ncbi:MAG: Asp23/Gls24 family envelope stress response protein [Actinomycetota bacterium]|nr:Asp23/Gls24 family envelope stress response protein [Actinomycetota bacterium]
MAEQSSSSQTQGSPLKTSLGTTTISTTVVQQIAGIAAQEVEKVQMGGGASAAVGGFLQSVTGSVTGGGSGGGSNFAKGVNAEVGEEEAAIDLTMAIEYGQSIPQLTEAARRNVINRVESLVGLRVNEVNITVVDVQVPEERPMLGQQEEVERQARQQEQRA